MSNPADLNIVSQPDTNKNYFNFKAANLKINETYAIKFQWAYSDGTLSDWSPGYFLTTSNETSPAVPTDATVPSTGIGSIPVTLTTFPTNAKRVDVIITGGVFGTSKIAYSFTAAGTTTIAAPAGTYQVQLRAISPTGVTSTVGTTFSVVISDAGEVIQSPTNPNGFSSKRILAGIEVSWAGTYATGTFTGFEAINIYAGSSATATNGTYEQVGVLTGNNVKNTIVVPLGTYVVYGQAVYIHAAAVNKNGSVGTIQANVTNQTLGPGKATDADINDGAVVISKLASDVLTVGNLKAGDINATSFIRAGTSGSARVEISSSTVGSVLPGLTVYSSDGTTQLLRAPLTGGLTINGGGTFTGNISGASGTFAGNLSSSNGQFSVTSGSISALSGSIGNWIINSGVLKSGTQAFPRVLLDPTNSQIVLRASEGASDSGNLIKLDPSVGIKVGTTALPKFTVAMAGNMSATDGTFNSGFFTGNITSSAIITGGTFRTAASGTRIEISSSSTNTIRFYNAVYEQPGSISVNSNGIYVLPPGSTYNSLVIYGPNGTIPNGAAFFNQVRLTESEDNLNTTADLGQHRLRNMFVSTSNPSISTGGAGTSGGYGSIWLTRES
jgi:hypothetical protein